MSSVIDSQKKLAADGDHCHWPGMSDGPLPRPTPEQNETLGARIQYAREFRKLKMNQLGRMAGLGSGMVSRLEAGNRGANIGFDVATRIAAALQVDVRWLTAGDLTWFNEEELRALRQRVAAFERENQVARRTPAPAPPPRAETERHRPPTIPPKSSPKRRAVSHGKKPR